MYRYLYKLMGTGYLSICTTILHPNRLSNQSINLPDPTASSLANLEIVSTYPSSAHQTTIHIYPQGAAPPLSYHCSRLVSASAGVDGARDEFEGWGVEARGAGWGWRRGGEGEKEMEEMEMSRRRRSEMDAVVLRCLEEGKDDGVLGTGKHVRLLGFWFWFWL